jgi:3-oxoacyl-[acyl-carrier protein] reductase
VETNTATSIGRTSGHVPGATCSLALVACLSTIDDLGRASLIRLPSGGAAVAINYRERDNDANNVVEVIVKSGGRASAFGADVSLSVLVRDMVHDVEKRLGPIDILVNNAGIAAVSRTLPKRISIAPS